MSVVDYNHPIRVACSSGIPSRTAMDLTLPAAYYSLPVSPSDLEQRSTPPTGSRRGVFESGSPHHPLPITPSLPPHVIHVDHLKGRELFAHSHEFNRLSPLPPHSPSPSHQLPSSSTHPFDLSNSFPPAAFTHRRHFQELERHQHHHNRRHHQRLLQQDDPGSPTSSNVTVTSDGDLGQSEILESRFEPKLVPESLSPLHAGFERGRVERVGLEHFPPAKRYVRAQPPSPAKSDKQNGIAFPGHRYADSTKSDNSEDIDVDDEEENRSDANSSKEVDLSFSSRSTFSTSPTSSYLPSFTSSLPTTSSGHFRSSLFPVSFMTPPFFKPNADVSSPFLKRRHSSHNPLVVDASIPFTTYLHNLTVTLQQAAARARSSPAHSDSLRGDPNDDQRSPNASPKTKPIYDAEPNRCPESPKVDVIKEEESRDQLEEHKVKEEREESEEVFPAREEHDERVSSADEISPKEVKEKRKGKLHFRERYASALFSPEPLKLRRKSRDERHPIAHPLSAPIMTSTGFHLSPDPSIISPTAIHGHHPYPQHHQQQQQPHVMASAQSLQEMVMPALRTPRSPRLQHPHLSTAVQFPSLYSKLFPPFTPSINPGHPNITNPAHQSLTNPAHQNLTNPAHPSLTNPGHQNPIPGQAQGLGTISSSAPRLNSLFHPAFLNMGSVGMRRPSTDKPPPVKKYKCDVCQKAFSRSNTLVTHKRIHTGDKPFKCEICGRAFRQPGNLTRHRLTHTTHKPYVCHVCNKAFNRASNLNTHIRTHSSFRHFGCTGCPKNVAVHFKPEMSSHVFAHNGERPFKCDICGRGFAHSSTLATHRRTHGTNFNPSKSSMETLTSVFG